MTSRSLRAAPAKHPLHALQVIAIRYRSDKLARGDERSLDAYAASGVYAHAGVPVDVVEPRFPEDQRVADEAANLGLLGGEIAAAVAAARREDKAVLMAGGDCTHCTGVLGGLQAAHGPAARIGVVWFDAHGDFNTSHTSLTLYLGGMPLAVCAGLAWPRWREASRIVAPLPTDRLVLVDVRNLDPAEERLIRATDAVIAAPAPGFPGEDLGQAVARLAARCDMIYLHVDSDVLDEVHVPSHGTREPDGPDMDQVLSAIETVMATGIVVAFAVVSVYGEGPGSDTTVASGIELIRGGLDAWRRHGMG